MLHNHDYRLITRPKMNTSELFEDHLMSNFLSAQDAKKAIKILGGINKHYQY